MANARRIPARRRQTAPATLMRRCLATGTGAKSTTAAAQGFPGPLKHMHLEEGLWFSASYPRRSLELGRPGKKPPDERTLKLGKTLRILQERLPTLLQSPLPSEILSPNISLHLFPSTHPHLPVVSGRVAYVAALWTSPLAWGRVPIVGNVRLEILSERMSKQPVHVSPRREGAGDEQLVVRWRTIGAAGRGGAAEEEERGNSGSSSSAPPPYPSAPVTTESSIGSANPIIKSANAAKEFTGLFIFEFDQEGRILSHTIEHVEEGGDWERSVGARFVGLTDWLLGGMRGGPPPVAAFQIQDTRKV